MSPAAFFQVNTVATEGLYSTIRDWCLATRTDGTAVETTSNETTQKEKDTVILDLCCGTGTIGLVLSQHVKKVIGVEMVKEAIEDAEKNAKLNGITNVSYLHGRVEEAIKQVFKEHVTSEDTNVVAILDPPRSGVHATVIQAIRGCKQLRRVIYVSCDAEAASSNLIEYVAFILLSGSIFFSSTH